MIVTIDGPAGAGKSSAAQALAERLGFEFLDTGAMYRAVTLAAVRRGLDWNRPGALPELARGLQIDIDDRRVWLDGEEVTDAIRTSKITSLVYHAANNKRVREQLVELQRRAAAGKNVVTEGRDQGTVVFPDAECKIFLTATPEERARRRMDDLTARGERIAFDTVLADQTLRDQRDAERSCGPLIRADDAIELVTDGLSPDEVVQRLEAIVRANMN
jgi:cytidylate kinase